MNIMRYTYWEKRNSSRFTNGNTLKWNKTGNYFFWQNSLHPEISNFFKQKGFIKYKMKTCPNKIILKILRCKMKTRLLKWCWKSLHFYYFYKIMITRIKYFLWKQRSNAISWKSKTLWSREYATTKKLLISRK